MGAVVDGVAGGMQRAWMALHRLGGWSLSRLSSSAWGMVRREILRRATTWSWSPETNLRVPPAFSFPTIGCVPGMPRRGVLEALESVGNAFLG